MGFAIDDEVRAVLKDSVLCWLATTGEDGYPNVSPKEIFTSHGEKLIVIANIASPTSVRNIRSRPQVCVSFVDVFRQRGFKIHGTGRVLFERDPAFVRLRDELAEMAGADYPIKSVIAVGAERITQILAPSYRLLPHLSDEDRMRNAYASYGVSPSGGRATGEMP